MNQSILPSNAGTLHCLYRPQNVTFTDHQSKGLATCYRLGVTYNYFHFMDTDFSVNRFAGYIVTPVGGNKLLSLLNQFIQTN